MAQKSLCSGIVLYPTFRDGATAISAPLRDEHQQKEREGSSVYPYLGTIRRPTPEVNTSRAVVVTPLAIKLDGAYTNWRTALHIHPLSIHIPNITVHLVG